jgi:hypothetical protein
LSQELYRGAQAVIRGAAYCASQVLDRGARIVAAAPRCSLHFNKAGSATTLSQQEKSTSAYVQRFLAAMYLADNYAAAAPPPKHV